MPRNGSGNYSLPAPPTPFQNGTTANAPDMMTVLNDIASVLTDSVAADGQTPMTGALNMNNQSINGANAIAAKSLTLNSVSLPALLLGYLYGMTLSNDGVTPNTVLDISSGICVDSAGAAFIQLSSFTKNITGSWAAGTGNAGMGQGLTATAATWYHVFAIMNNGAADVYFDTSPAAANAPAGTTAFRRIGAFRLDASVHILPFVQKGSTFLWKSATHDISSLAITQTPSLQALQNVPLGVQVNALLWVAYTNSGVATGALIDSPDMNSVNGSGILFLNIVNPTAGATNWEQMEVRTDTSQNVRVVSATNANNSLQIWVVGWTDYL